MPTGATTPSIDWRVEIAAAVRDGLACRRCGLDLVDDAERAFTRIDPAGADDLDNIAIVCPACRNAHAVHPEPMPGPDERTELVA